MPATVTTSETMIDATTAANMPPTKGWVPPDKIRNSFDLPLVLSNSARRMSRLTTAPRHPNKAATTTLVTSISTMFVFDHDSCAT